VGSDFLKYVTGVITPFSAALLCLLFQPAQHTADAILGAHVGRMVGYPGCDPADSTCNGHLVDTRDGVEHFVLCKRFGDASAVRNDLD
jgi:hypothetical protein